jgi:hypothetical protein
MTTHNTFIKNLPFDAHSAVLRFLNPLDQSNLEQVSRASRRTVEEFKTLNDTRIAEQDCRDRFQRRYCKLRAIAGSSGTDINWTFYLTSIFLELSAKNIGPIQNNIYIEPWNMSAPPAAHVQYLYGAYTFVGYAHVDYTNRSHVDIWRRYAGYCAKLVETSILSAKNHRIPIDIDDWYQKMTNQNMTNQNIGTELGDVVWKTSQRRRPAFTYFGIRKFPPF